MRSNCRWCSDTLEFACWNGEVVRVAFALDCHDRKAISWVATTAGISGEMIRDMMVRCIERRFGAIRAPHPVQWLSDNGSILRSPQDHRDRPGAQSRPVLHPGRKPAKQRYGRSFRENPRRIAMICSLVNLDRFIVRPPSGGRTLPKSGRVSGAQVTSDPECRRTRSHRQLDGGLQHRASPLQTGLSLTPRVHPLPTRCVSGLIGSTPLPPWRPLRRAYPDRESEAANSRPRLTLARYRVHILRHC
jgi:Integrase core domain